MFNLLSFSVVISHNPLVGNVGLPRLGYVPLSPLLEDVSVFQCLADTVRHGYYLRMWTGLSLPSFLVMSIVLRFMLTLCTGGAHTAQVPRCAQKVK